MSELLIDRNDFELYRPLPRTLDWESIVYVVIRIQRGWVCNALGRGLYYDVCTNQAQARNVTLLDGGTTTVNNNTAYFFGLKPAIVLYAYANYIKQNDMRVTRAGNKVKMSAESETSPYAAIVAEYNKAMSEAQDYMTQVIEYLNDNASSYTLWKGGSPPRGAIKVGGAGNIDFYSEDTNYYGR